MTHIVSLLLVSLAGQLLLVSLAGQLLLVSLAGQLSPARETRELPEGELT